MRLLFVLLMCSSPCFSTTSSGKFPDLSANISDASFREYFKRMTELDEANTLERHKPFHIFTEEARNLSRTKCYIENIQASPKVTGVSGGEFRSDTVGNLLECIHACSKNPDCCRARLSDDNECLLYGTDSRRTGYLLSDETIVECAHFQKQDRECVEWRQGEFCKTYEEKGWVVNQTHALCAASIPHGSSSTPEQEALMLTREQAAEAREKAKGVKVIGGIL